MAIALPMMSLTGCFEGHRRADTYCLLAEPHTFSDAAIAAMSRAEKLRERNHSCTWARLCAPRDKDWKEVCDGES